jgi:hypothetical protein
MNRPLCAVVFAWLGLLKRAGALILVTHHVNIRQFVSESIGSGEMVLVRVNRRGEYISHTRYPARG